MPFAATRLTARAAPDGLVSSAAGITADDAVALLAEVPGVGQVQVLESDGGITLAAVHEGSIQPLVQALGRLPLTDLVIGEPDLEEAVLKLYEGGPEEPRLDNTPCSAAPFSTPGVPPWPGRRA